MKVPFCDLKRLYAEQRSDLDAACSRVLGSGHYILGPECDGLEREISHLLGTGKIVTCNSGTDALIISLRLAGVRAGDDVLTPSLTAVPTISAILAVGARPVFVDIDPATWLIDPQDAAEVVSSRAAAAIAVHLYGNPVDARTLSTATNTPVVEDVAQALGARFVDGFVGTRASLGAFSFYPTKNLGAFGDGGAIWCPNEDQERRARMLRYYGQATRYQAEMPGGINSRLDEIQAALLRVRLQKLFEWNELRVSQVTRYRNALVDLPIQFQVAQPQSAPAWHLFVIALENGEIRDRLQMHLEGQGIQSLIHYPIPNHEQKAFRDFVVRPLPHTEALAKRILSLPMYPGLSQEEQACVISSIRAFFSNGECR